MKISIQVVTAVLFILSAETVSSQSIPSQLLIDSARLERLRLSYQRGDTQTVLFVEEISNAANKLLPKSAPSVMEKQRVPVSGNKHDYMSQAPYFWYDSTKANGRPYIRRDGERNPEINLITDRTRLGDLENYSNTLALAYYFTGKEVYAGKVAKLLRTWFLDTATRMNPNLDYGQGIPGINDGRGIGIIESRCLIGIAEAASMIRKSTAWKPADMRALKNWYSQFLTWMLQSKNGKEEHAADNNHGTWYYAQVIDFALFTNNLSLAKSLANEARTLLDSQLDSNGSFPLELARTNALEYSTFNLAAWMQVARLASLAGVDIYNYQTKKGSSLKQAFDWLRPYALGEKKWSWQQIVPYEPEHFRELLPEASVVFNMPQYQNGLQLENLFPLLLYRLK